MLTFKNFFELSEAESKPVAAPKPKETEASRVKDKQDRENDDLRARQQAELETAREKDFRDKEAEIKQKNSDKAAEERRKDQERRAKQNEEEIHQSLEAAVNEYLEIGTDEIVAAYRKCVPGQ